MGNRISLAWALCALMGAPASAQTVGSAWQALGPGPATDGQVEGIAEGHVVGAVNALAAHPTDANVLYAGAVNGGIWRTTDATSAPPTWTRLGDALRSLSIGALEFDPTDANRLTLVAGAARTSSLGGRGGAQSGLFRTVDGGTVWTAIDGAGALNGRVVNGIAARSATLVVATTSGLFRSTNSGAAFALLSADGSSGLPNGNTVDLANDAADNARLYTAVIGTSTARGIYRSTNTGASWSKVSNATVDAVINTGTGANRIELVAGTANTVYAAIVVAGRLAEVFRSADGGNNWAAMGVPLTIEESGTQIGAHPGGQGGRHLSLIADPGNSNVVYIGGDRQPYFSEATGGNNFFPNASGANDYSGRLFRGDASAPAASRWALLTHTGTANHSAPHADSRDMVFDAQGNLIESDDGGVYKRSLPLLSTGNWFSMNGNLQTAEYHSIAYDSVSNRVIGGAQDTGTTEENLVGSSTFRSVSTADGGDVAVNDVSSTALSTRYSSFQFLGDFRRQVVNAANVVQSSVLLALTPINGSLEPEFYSPIAVNEINGQRLLIGAMNGVYESLDQGGTINQISTTRINAIAGSPLVYGVPGNADLILTASANEVYLRTTAAGALALTSTVGGLTLRDVALDPLLPSRVFAMNSSVVYFSINSGTSFNPIVGNLASFDAGELRSMSFITRADDNALVVAADRGAFIAFASDGFASWSRLGSELPNAPVSQLDYDRGDQVLIAGVLGRGAWKLDASTISHPINLFKNGFE